VSLAGRQPSAPEQGFLELLGSDNAQRLRSLGIVRSYPRGVALFHEGQQSDRVFIVVSGRIKLVCVTDEGKEIVVAIRGAGDLLGELAALDGLPRSASGIALDDVEALVIPPGDFAAFLERHSEVALTIARTLGCRLRDADRKRVEFATQDSVGRLASRLVELLERFGEPVGDGLLIDLPISQEELAGWTGCSRDAITKALHTMRELGWLETRRRSFLVTNPEALKKRAV
jgi:CRP/FNR family transcriptional regulator, cyclic AMP receptor protein